jgi:hypothetical protein
MRLTRLRTPAALAIALGLAACGGQSAPPAATPAPPTAAAQPAAPKVADLDGARASTGEGEMGRRGFTPARTRGLTAYWWHAPSSSCVETVTSGGRYRTVRAVAAASCGR